MHTLRTEGLEFPMKVKVIPKFEKNEYKYKCI